MNNLTDDHWYLTCFDETYIELDRLYHPPEVNRMQAEGIAQMLRLRRGEQVLDVCCGYGRHLIPLTGLKYFVTGIDLSSCMVREIENCFAGRPGTPPVLQCDMREIPFVSRFDAAYLAGTSFGIFPNPEQDLLALENIFKCLQSRGRLLIDQINPQVFFSNSQAVRNSFKLRGQTIEEEVMPVPDWNCYLVNRVLCRGSWKKQWTMKYRKYDADSLSGLLKKSGFRVREICGGYDGRRYSETSNRMIFVAQK